jgi:hypothetical protein
MRAEMAAARTGFVALEAGQHLLPGSLWNGVDGGGGEQEERGGGIHAAARSGSGTERHRVGYDGAALAAAGCMAHGCAWLLH